MKINHFLFAIVFFISQNIHSASLRIIDPQQSWMQYFGYLENVEMEISPIGNQAQIELTFSINVDSLTKSYYYGSLPTYLNKMLETQMNFDLPNNAYIYDSYLWLDNTTIIKAIITDRTSAINTYEGIVKRRRDPSILVRNNATNYSFNIYPISTTYARKVKLIYTVPFEFNTVNSEMIPLPNSILQYASPNASVKIKINKSTDYVYSNTIFPFKYNTKNVTAQYTELVVYGSNFKKQTTSYIEMYNINSSPLVFNYYPQSANQGYYELKVHGSMLNNLTTNTKVFNSSIPFSGNGITYDKFNSSSNTLNAYEDYTEMGAYEGVLNTSDSVSFSYFTNNNFYQIKVPFPTKTHVIFKNNWVNAYCLNNPNANESRIYSLLNRVLSNNTAFLALETGDTVSTPINDMNIQGGGNSGGITVDLHAYKEDEKNISIYPNPFVDYFVVKSQYSIEKIEIYQINGSLIYKKDINDEVENKNEVKIESKELDSSLSNGIYYIVVHSKGGVFHFKLNKI